MGWVSFNDKKNNMSMFLIQAEKLSTYEKKILILCWIMNLNYSTIQLKGLFWKGIIKLKTLIENEFSHSIKTKTKYIII